MKVLAGMLVPSGRNRYTYLLLAREDRRALGPSAAPLPAGYKWDMPHPDTDIDTDQLPPTLFLPRTVIILDFTHENFQACCHSFICNTATAVFSSKICGYLLTRPATIIPQYPPPQNNKTKSNHVHNKRKEKKNKNLPYTSLRPRWMDGHLSRSCFSQTSTTSYTTSTTMLAIPFRGANVPRSTNLFAYVPRYKSKQKHNKTFSTIKNHVSSDTQISYPT